MHINYQLYSKCYSILIGVGNYAHLKELKSPKKDVLELKKCLEDLCFEKTPNNENVLLCEKATKEGIEQMFYKFEKKLEGKTKKENIENGKSLLVIYFSGHGSKHTKGINNVFYLCPYDFEGKNFFFSYKNSQQKKFFRKFS